MQRPAPNNSLRTYLLLSFAVFIGTGLILYTLGRTPFCTCGTLKFWHGVVFSSENSQHLTDWYTPSHIIHGFLFYGILWLLSRRIPALAPVGLRFLLAVVIESGWEILENDSFIIERYRAVTMSLDYYGDSVINSLSDIAAMALGFAIAARIPLWLTVALALSMELFTGYFIHDNLTLNIIMLTFPQENIRAWQAIN